MIHTTRGLVFQVSRFSDSSGIIKIYTESLGLQSFIVKSLFSRNSRIRPALFGHLTLLDIVFDHKPNKNIQFFKEVNINQPFHEINDHLGKSTILLFLNEILFKTIKEEEANEALFNFIIDSLNELDQTKLPIHSFHLLFLVKLTGYLGFGIPESLISGHDYFDLLTGLSSNTRPDHTYYIDGQPLDALEELSLLDYPQLAEFNYPRNIRLSLLDKLLDFFKIHMPEMTELKSVKVLHEIMS